MEWPSRTLMRHLKWLSDYHSRTEHFPTAQSFATDYRCTYTGALYIFNQLHLCGLAKVDKGTILTITVRGRRMLNLLPK